MDSSKPAICGHRKSGHFRRPETGVEFLLHGVLCSQGRLDLGAPASRPALQHVRVMEEAVEQRGDGEIAPQEAVGGHAEFERGVGGLFGDGGTVLPGEGEDAEDATDAGGAVVTVPWPEAPWQPRRPPPLPWACSPICRRRSPATPEEISQGVIIRRPVHHVVPTTVRMTAVAALQVCLFCRSMPCARLFSLLRETAPSPTASGGSGRRPALGLRGRRGRPGPGGRQARRAVAGRTRRPPPAGATVPRPGDASLGEGVVRGKSACAACAGPAAGWRQSSVISASRMTAASLPPNLVSNTVMPAKLYSGGASFISRCMVPVRFVASRM